MLLPWSSWSGRSWLELNSHFSRRWPSSWRKVNCIPSSRIWVHRMKTKKVSSMRTSQYWRCIVMGWAYPKYWLTRSWRNCTLWYQMWPRPTVARIWRQRYRQESTILHAWCWLGRRPFVLAGWRTTCSTANFSEDTGNPRRERMSWACWKITRA